MKSNYKLVALSITIVFSAIICFPSAAQLKQKSIDKLDQTITDNNLTEFDNLLKKIYRSPTEVSEFDFMDNMDLPSFLIKEGKPEFLNTLLDRFVVYQHKMDYFNGWNRSILNGLTKENIISEANEIKEKKELFKRLEDDYNSDRIKSYSMQESWKQHQYIEEGKFENFADELFLNKVDELLLLNYVEQVRKYNVTDDGLKFLLRLEKVTVKSEDGQKKLLDLITKTCQETIAKRIKEEQAKLSLFDNSIKSLYGLLEYSDNISKSFFYRFDLPFQVKQIRNKSNFKNVGYQQVGEFQREINSRICMVLEDNYDKIKEGVNYENYGVFSELYDTFSSSALNSNPQLRRFFSNCKNFSELRDLVDCEMNSFDAERWLEKYPLIWRPKYNVSGASSLGYIITNPIKSIYDGMFAKYDGTGTDGRNLFLYLLEKSKACGSPDNPNYEIYQTKYDRVTMDGNIETDRVEGNVQTYYVEPKYLEFFKKQEGPGSRTFTQEVWSAIFQLKGVNADVAQVQSTKKGLVTFFENCECEDKAMNQLELNLLLNYHNLAPAQELFNSCAE